MDEITFLITARCADCIFWQRNPAARLTNGDMRESNEGTCRRFPPAIDTRQRRWPVTYSHEKCGEFKLKRGSKDG